MKLEKVKDKIEYDVELDECKIKVGGRDEVTGGKFIPNINMSKWDDECWLNVNYPFAITDEVETFDDEEIEIELENKKHKYYVKEGKLEYEIKLESKPISNEIKLDLKFPDGLDFWPQEKLTQEEIEQGFKRPENVIDSYAVYWKRKNNKYETGKFCHIYRIKIRDKEGKWSWCEQDIIGKVWIIIIPRDFLDNAVYPVIIDPILGYSTPGASHTGQNTLYYGMSDTTDGDGGNIITFHAAIFSVHATLKGIKIVCAETVAGDPSNCDVVEQIEYDVNASDDEDAAAVGSNILDPSTAYYLAIITEGGSSTAFKYDSCVDTYYYKGSVAYADQYPSPLPTVSSGSNLIFSIWIDYEPVGGEEFVRSIADNIGITDVLLRSAAFKRSIGGAGWTQQTSSFGVTPINDVAYNGLDLWVAVADAGKIAISSNGINWTQQDNPFGTNAVYGIAHNQSDLWVAVGKNGKLATSLDGIDWVERTSSFGTYSIVGIDYNGSNLWVAVGYQGKLATSSDGINWFQQTSSFVGGIYHVAHNQSNLWVAVGSSGQLATSSDGENWTQVTDSSFGTDTIYGIAYNGSNLWVAVGASCKIATSPDGENWTQQASSFGTDTVYCVAHNQLDLWVAGGANGKIATSPDGENWIQQANPFGVEIIWDFAYNGSGLWVAVGEDGILATSSFKGIGITDILSRSGTFIRNIVDTIGVTDTLSRLVSFTRKVIDTIGITDTLMRSVDFVRKIVDTINILDVFDIIKRTANSFSICRIIKIKEKLVSKIIQNITHKNSKINGK